MDIDLATTAYDIHQRNPLERPILQFEERRRVVDMSSTKFLLRVRIRSSADHWAVCSIEGTQGLTELNSMSS